jgi:hypothetical protein
MLYAIRKACECCERAGFIPAWRVRRNLDAAGSSGPTYAGIPYEFRRVADV